MTAAQDLRLQEPGLKLQAAQAPEAFTQTGEPKLASRPWAHGAQQQKAHWITAINSFHGFLLYLKLVHAVRSKSMARQGLGLEENLRTWVLPSP